MDTGNILFMALFLAVWFILVRYILPKIGVPT
jgi:hypothetical protein